MRRTVRARTAHKNPSGRNRGKVGQAGQHSIKQTQEEVIQMSDNSMDIFGRAMLYIYQAGLENLGLKGELKAVRVTEPERPEQEAAG